jgi:hypothetical protein
MDKELLMELLPFFTMGEVNEELEANIDGSILKVSVIKKEDENKITMTLDFEQNENDEFKFRFNFLDENERETKDVKCFERKKMIILI